MSSTPGSPLSVRKRECYNVWIPNSTHSAAATSPSGTAAELTRSISEQEMDQSTLGFSGSRLDPNNVHWQHRMFIRGEDAPRQRVECSIALTDVSILVKQRWGSFALEGSISARNASGSSGAATMTIVPVNFDGRECKMIPYADIKNLLLHRGQGFSFAVVTFTGEAITFESLDGLPSMEEAVETIRALVERHRRISESSSGKLPIIAARSSTVCMPVCVAVDRKRRRTLAMQSAVSPQ